MEKKWWTLVVVCAATFMLLLDITIVIVALPEIQTGLHAGFSDVEWVVDAYALTLASVLLSAGSLADRYGRRRLFTIGLIIFTLGSALCGAAQSPLMLIISRSFQGIGGAVLFSTALALIAQEFHGRERGVAFGAWGAITGLATGMGPILGGAITTGISWRGIFLVNVPIGIVALWIVRTKVDESKVPDATTPDWAGFGLLTAGLVSLVYGLIRAGEIAWSDTGVIVLLCLAAVFLSAFLYVESKVAHPLFDLKLFRVPTFDGGLIAAFCMNGSLFAMFLYIVLYLQDDLGFSALGTGLRMLLITGATLVAATIAGRLSSSVPVRWLVGPGLVIVGIGTLLMAGITGTSSWTHLIPGFVIAGVGSGMVNPPLASTAVGVVEPQRSGMAAGVNNTFRQIGVAVGIAVYGSIFASSLEHKLGSALSTSPTLESHAGAVIVAVEEGEPTRAFAAVPAGSRHLLEQAIHTGFAGTLNELFIVSGILALVGGVASAILIHNRDFVVSRPEPELSQVPAG